MRAKGIQAVFAAVLFGLSIYLFRAHALEQAIPSPPTAAEVEASREQIEQRRAQAADARRRRDVEREEQRKRKLAADDDAVAAALSSNARWSILPSFVREVAFDAAGRPWFSTTDPYNPQLLRQSIEAAAAGKTRAVRGGTLLLVDRSGRFWAVDERAPHELLCYDGTSWLTPRLATGEEAFPEGSDRSASERGQWYEGGFEDSAGNLYFIGGSFHRTGFGVHRRTADGRWSIHFFTKPKEADYQIESNPVFFEQAGGKVCIFPRTGEGSGHAASARVLRFDGTAWSSIDPRFCGSAHHDARAIIPLPDGSIGSVCDGSRFWRHWPEGYTPAVKQDLDALIRQLEHDDPVVREAASAELITLGGQAGDLLAHAEAEDLGPEARMRLQDVARTIALQGSEKHDNPGLYGGRFMFESCYLLSRGRDGSARFYVEHCTDRRTNEIHRESVIQLSADGAWSVVPIPTKQWDEVGVPPDPAERFEDSRGGIWLRFGFRTEPDMSAQPVGPDGLTYRHVFGEDADGRVYLDGRTGMLVFDPRVPEPAPAVELKRMYGGRMIRVGDANRGWASFGGRVLCIGAGGAVTAVPGNWEEDVFVTWVLPLRDGVLVTLDSYDRMVEKAVRLWDGKRWLTLDGNLRESIRTHAAEIAPLAGTGLDAYDPIYHELLRVAGDGKSRLWFSSHQFEFIGNDGEQRLTRRLEYFDGVTWHDVWKDLGIADPVKHGRTVCTAKGGRAVVIESPVRKMLYLVEYDDAGKVQAVDLAPLPAGQVGPAVRDFVSAPGERLWLSMVNSPLACVREDGAFEQAGFMGKPVLADSRGRGWATGVFDGALRVHVDGKWAAASVAGADTCGDVVESPDGRIWLLTADALVEVRVETAGAQPEVREVGRWNWNTPRNHLERAFCDEAGGLWIIGEGHRLTRVTLPPPQERDQRD